MKNFLLLITFSYALTANAQDIYITFSGEGVSSTVSSVNVENLTSGKFLIISGGDILHLTSITTGLNSIENDPFSKIKIYPNPMTDYSSVQIFPPIKGDAVITIVDITGKPVAQVKSYLENSMQEFRITGVKNGFYLINVKGPNYQFSGKLLSNARTNESISIEKLNNISVAAERKTVKTHAKGSQATVDMEYTNGDRLKFTGISGKFSTVLTDIPTEDKTIAFDFIDCTDGDNNSYPVVKIGNQIWMGENLKTTKYRNGDLIETTIPSTLDISTVVNPKYQWPSDDPIYGRLYTWYSVDDSRHVCPAGWHIPSNLDWITLTNFLGGVDVAGISMKEPGFIHWWNRLGVIEGNNESGFTGLPAGCRYTYGLLTDMGKWAFWWSSTETDDLGSFVLGIYYWYTSADSGNQSKAHGLSVRCLKD